jgi:hypothetical protein
MKLEQRSVLAIPLLITALLFCPILSAQPLPQGASQPGSQSGSQSAPQSGVSVDPSVGPLNPSGTPGQTTAPPLPEAPQPVPQPKSPAQSATEPATESSPQQPLGAAAAEQVKTAGGGASRPAGNAIAPVKQHQYRSLVIKLGAVAAAGIAAGAVYGLSHATPSVPAHSASAAAK